MNIRQLKRLGVPDGPTARLAVRLIVPAVKAGLPKGELRHRIAAVVADPAAHRDDPYFAELARAMLGGDDPKEPRDRRTGDPAPYRQWGTELEPQSIQQMENACRLPVSVAGALMADAHVGYGLPIGGVLATENAVVPYAVGVDIACRMKLTVLDLPPEELLKREERLIKAIETETRFGVGSEFPARHRRDHAVMEEDWSVSPVTKRFRDKAAAQLGTSGSGNHFVEFGTLTLDQAELGLAPGTYLALLSHSGSRGTGASVCDFYSKLAMSLHPDLPAELRYLAWLDLGSQEGDEYWAAMNLMGRYAAANHALIHQHLARHLDAEVLLDVENHHNFAWEEEHVVAGVKRKLIVHRKGATPAGAGVLGVIPGSMASPGFIVRGKGSAESLMSASHGAGRVMSRTKARQTYRWAPVRDYLEHRGVRLISAGIDEVPFVYKDIMQVMAAQRDLVEPIARFDPKLVKMAPEGERPED